MFEKPTATFPLGLEVDGQLLRGALLNYNGGNPLIERLFVVPLEIAEPTAACVLSPMKLVQPPLARDRLRRALFITGLNPEEALVRPLEVKLTKVRDIDAVLQFQSEPLIPYPIENAVLDRWIIGPIEDGTQLSVLAVRKDHLQHHLSFYESIKIEPEVVSCYAAGLAAFAKHFAAVPGPAFVVHLARRVVLCLLVENGKVLGCHAVPSTVEALLEATAGMSHEQRAALDFTSLEGNLNPELSTAADSLRQALVRTVFALTKQSRGKELNSVLMTGEGATIGNLATCFAQILKKERILPPDPPDPAMTINELLIWAVPIGLAYTALPLPTSEDQINFRRGEFSYANPWRRLTKPVSIYLCACLLLAFSIYFVGNAVRGFQDIRIREEYADLLGRIGKTPAAFELELQGKTPSVEMLAEPASMSLKSLSYEQINSRLNTIEKQITSAPDIFPLEPNIPRVADVLAWLDSHAKVVKTDSKTGQGVGSIRIESFNYSMVKRPDKTKPSEHYLARVDLEFTGPDSKTAREFYDALAEPNEIVDPKSEVTWSSGQGKYRVSFFLKDNTVYP